MVAGGSSRAAPLGRGIAFALVAAYVVLAPAHWHVPGLAGAHLPDWAMFYRGGIHQCRVRYFTVAAGGALEPVDRRAVLRLDRPGLGRRDRAMRKKASVRHQAKKICKRLHVKDLRADAACSTMDGWKQVYDVDRNLCPKPRAKRKKRRAKDAR